MIYSRLQQDFNTGNSFERQHYFPRNVYEFAVLEQLKYKERPVPTLPDIYFHLAQRGLDLVESGQVVPTFTDISKEGNRAARVKFPYDVNDRIVALKLRAERGDFPLPDGNVSLVSFAVVLMEVAILDIQAQRSLITIENAAKAHESLKNQSSLYLALPDSMKLCEWEDVENCLPKVDGIFDGDYKDWLLYVKSEARQIYLLAKAEDKTENEAARAAISFIHKKAIER